MTGVQARPQVAARPNTAKSKRGQRRECERTHTSLLQTHHPQIQAWTATGVRAHPHVAATNSSPPQIQAWTATGVRAHPLIATTDSTPPDKRAQRRECERTHSSPPQTRHRQINVHSDGSASAPTRRCHKLVTPQIQAWTATGVRAHPLIAATDSTPPDKRAQRRECERTHTSLPQTRHPPDPSVDSDGSASAPTHRCHRLDTARETCTVMGVRAHPHVAARLVTPRSNCGQ